MTYMEKAHSSNESNPRHWWYRHELLKGKGWVFFFLHGSMQCLDVCTTPRSSTIRSLEIMLYDSMLFWKAFTQPKHAGRLYIYHLVFSLHPTWLSYQKTFLIIWDYMFHGSNSMCCLISLCFTGPQRSKNKFPCSCQMFSPLSQPSWKMLPTCLLPLSAGPTALHRSSI
jgi:hypothetical protein